MSQGIPTSVRWIGLALAVSVVALIVPLVLTLDRDEALPAVRLPVPSAPVTRPLLARGRDGVGWTWVNPLPRWMPSWNGVDVDAQGRAVLVGHLGSVASYENGGLITWRSNTRERLRAVTWAGANDALAVGDAGTVVWLTASGPSVLEGAPPLALRAVAVVAADKAWAAGDDGTLLEITRTAITPLEMRIDGGMDLLAMHVRGSDFFVVGEGGVVVRIADGGIASQASQTNVTLRAIGGCDGGDLYAVGDEGRALRYLGEDRWETIDLHTRAALEGVACAGEYAVIVGAEGTVRLAAGRDSVALESGGTAAFHGVSGDGENVWMVGEGGRLAAFEHDHVRILTSGPTDSLRDMAPIAGALVGVGEWGRIVREQEDGFHSAQSPTKAGLAAVRPIREDSLVAVGDEGAIVEIGPTDARLVASPTDRALRDLVTADGRILAVGAGGTIVRGTLDALAVSTVGTDNLWSVDGTPTDAIAVGDEGRIVRLSETGASPIVCAIPEHLSLRAVVRRDAIAWAGGEQGLVVRIDGDVCTMEVTPRPDKVDIAGIGLGPSGMPIVVGERGFAFERTADGAWRESSVDVGQVALRNVVREERYVYLLGAGGTLVRHILLDGT